MIEPMSEHPTESGPMDLQKLENQVDQLIDQIERLSLENSSLRQQSEALQVERGSLLRKTELARSRVEAIISRLRSLEQS